MDYYNLAGTMPHFDMSGGSEKRIDVHSGGIEINRKFNNLRNNIDFQ